MSSPEKDERTRWRPDLNFVVFMGELARDPALHRTDDGLPVATLRIASADTRAGPTGAVKHTNYIEVKVFGRDAERCCTRLRRGAPVTVQGKLDYYEWRDADGDRRTGLRVLAEDVFTDRSHRRPWPS